MKKYFKTIIPLFFIGILGYFGYQIITKIKHKSKVAEHIKTIPSFSFENTKGGNYSKETLKVGIPTLFIYFNTECEFCNEETQMIQDNIEKFNNIQLVFISFEKKEVIKAFAKKYKLDTYDNINFLCDSKINFAATFDVKSLPCLVLYDKDQKIIEKIKGQTKIEVLLRKLQIKN